MPSYLNWSYYTRLDDTHTHIHAHFSTCTPNTPPHAHTSICASRGVEGDSKREGKRNAKQRTDDEAELEERGGGVEDR